MKKPSTNPSRAPDRKVAAAGQAARRFHLGADGSVVTLEDGEPCLENLTDGGQWDWDTEAVSSVVRCQDCGNSERVFKEPDGRILCEACLLRGPAQALPASV